MEHHLDWYALYLQGIWIKYYEENENTLVHNSHALPYLYILIVKHIGFLIIP